MSTKTINALIARAENERFNLVWIQSYKTLDAIRNDYRGTQIELQGHRDEALLRSERAKSTFIIREMDSESDWNYVEDLLQFSGRTRFSSDPHISVQSVRSHKLAMLKAHIRDRQGIIAIAFAPGTQPRPVGYICMYLRNDIIRIYELVTAPSVRTGFAALNLISHQLRRFALRLPHARHVVVTIYQDNTASIRLFQNLGLKIIGQPIHFYHCWPKHITG